jgi:iron complex transport system substrate-binding protein
MLVYAVAPKIAVNCVFKITDAAKLYLPKDYYENKPYTDGAAEEIIKLHPDIVFMADELSPSIIDKANKMQEKISIPVVLLEMNMLKYKEDLAFLGEILGKKKEANVLADFIKTYLDKIQDLAKQIPEKEKLHVYYAEGPNGLNTDPSGSKHSQIIDFIGAINVAKVGIVPGTGMSQASMEQLLVWQPEIILSWTGNAQHLVTYNYVTTDPLWSNIDAVKKKQVYQIPWLPFGWFDRPPGTNRIIGCIWTANLLYPKIYNFDMVKVTQEYFLKFYHIKLSEADAKKLLNPKPNL